MKVLSLGHIGFLLEMESPDGQTVRILGDPWLTDYTAGDLMGRFPRLRYADGALGRIDGVFLSHSHSDHFDPASLMQLWRDLDEKPVLIFPQSLMHLEDLTREFLEGVEILYLRENESVSFQGLELLAFFNLEHLATNEDDVMVLTVQNGRELFVDEADALLPFYDQGARAALSETFSDPRFESVCFLTAKNELEATMSSLSASSIDERRERVGRSLERSYAEIEEIFSPVDDAEGDMWSNPRLVRLVGGQGMCYPQALGGNWNRVLFPIRLRDRVAMEQEISGQFGQSISIEEFVPGYVHEISGGGFVGRERAEWLELLDEEDDRAFDPNAECFDSFPIAPLRNEVRDSDPEADILKILNERFLPHLVGTRNPPVEHLLGMNEGEYRIRVRYGSVEKHEDRDYAITFGELRFHRVDLLGVEIEGGDASSISTDGLKIEGTDPDEFYWGNDLEDYLRGHCDEFSNFCRRPLPGKAQRLWACLGLPFLNNDLVAKKLRMHFERAQRGESMEDWALPFYPENS